MTDLERFQRGMTLLVETLDHGRILSDALREVYWRAVRDLSDAQFEHAVERALLELKFFPKPAELRELAGAGVSSVKDRGAVAWARVLRMLERVGTYESVDFGDPATHFAIGVMGGWHLAAAWDVLDGFKQTEFIRLYAAYENTGGTMQVPAMLLGQYARTNGGQVYYERGALPAPVVYRMLPDGTITKRVEPRKALDAAGEPKALGPATAEPMDPTAVKALLKDFTATLPEPKPEKRPEPLRLESGERFFAPLVPDDVTTADPAILPAGQTGATRDA